MNLQGIHQLKEQFERGTLTPTELVKQIGRKLENEDPAIWIHRISHESLLERARDLEKSSPKELPLYGIPFAVKDNIDVAGWLGEPLQRIGALYRLGINDYRGERSPQLVIDSFWAL